MDREQSRYLITLNAATTAVRNAGDPSISYLDQGVVYYLSLLDTFPHSDVAQEYHTVVWICPEYDWSQTSHDEGHICFIEYAANPEDGICSSATLSTPQA